ncbi:MAG: crossover junction endodeoxyribonuclease RuvC [Coriobacteriia bacterium]|nr:crossover junction endodeoxyribonuclease RuvC [Coriobacteriia bacterium]MCL2606657.1 crossover junction endodeoxyribonuclease RuvC [Coriobacteriia bacterium]
MSTVLGIDPGLQHTGWAIISNSDKNSMQAVAYGVISTNAKDVLSARLAMIFDDLTTVIERYQPTSCALEGVFFGLNAKTALSLGQARGAAILATAHKGLSMGEYPPATIKQAIVGTGNAEKEQITYMVRQLLNLDHDPQPDHCADALAVAITHLTHQDYADRADRSYK